jgi:hypothetical protein
MYHVLMKSANCGIIFLKLEWYDSCQNHFNEIG